MFQGFGEVEVAVLISGANGQRCRVEPNGLALVLKRRGFVVQAVSELEVDPVVIGVLALRSAQEWELVCFVQQEGQKLQSLHRQVGSRRRLRELDCRCAVLLLKGVAQPIAPLVGISRAGHGEQSLPVLAFRPDTPAQLNPVLDRCRELAPDRTITDQRARSRWIECEDVNPVLAECRGVLGVEIPLFVGLLARFERTRLPDFFQLQ